MEGFLSNLITFGYVIITLGLILSPFFIIRKLKNIKWRHIFLGYFLSAVIFGGITWLDFWFDKWLYNYVYNSNWIMQSLLVGTRYQWLLLMLILTFSPFLITKIKYKNFNRKRIIINILLSILIGFGVFMLWMSFIAWSLGKMGELYF